MATVTKGQVNPYPERVPNEVWEAFTAFGSERNHEESAKKWKHFMQVKASYQQNPSYVFLKDEEGNFIKTTEEKEVPNE